MLFNMAFPDYSITSLIPASVAVQPTLSEEQQKLAKLHLTVLEKIFNDRSPIRSTFSAMAFMLQNPQLMQKFMSATPDQDNGLTMPDADPSAQDQAMQLLQLFECFVKSFNVGALLHSMAALPPELVQQATSHLEELNAILGADPAYNTFIQGLAFGLSLQQANPSPPNSQPNKGAQRMNSLRELKGIFLSTNGNVIKNLGRAADVVFDNVKDANDALQSWTSKLKDVPVLSKAVEPVHQTVNKILDKVHMVVGDTADSIGESLQSKGDKILKESDDSAAFVNDSGIGLDQIIKT